MHILYFTIIDIYGMDSRCFNYLCASTIIVYLGNLTSPYMQNTSSINRYLDVYEGNFSNIVMCLHIKSISRTIGLFVATLGFLLSGSPADASHLRRCLLE